MVKAGSRLQEVRLSKDLNLEQVSKATKIKSSFLDAIEKGEYDKLPSVSYAQGFVKNYAKFLGLSEDEIMPLFRREFDEDKNFRVLPKEFEKSEEFSLSKFKLKQTFVVIIIIFLFLLGYIAYQYRFAILPPMLSIDSPKDNSSVSSSQILVKGKTDSNATVYINSDAVTVDVNGIFKKTIDVFPGKATITIRAINRFQKETDKKIEIDVQGGS